MLVFDVVTVIWLFQHFLGILCFGMYGVDVMFKEPNLGDKCHNISLMEFPLWLTCACVYLEQDDVHNPKNAFAGAQTFT